MPSLICIHTRYTSTFHIMMSTGMFTHYYWMQADCFGWIRAQKARKACALRALRTSSGDSGNHRWRILVELAGFEPVVEAVK
ncbi:hypothetical protein SODG_001144 [Sodalis praecaptivus]